MRIAFQIYSLYIHLVNTFIATKSKNKNLSPESRTMIKQNGTWKILSMSILETDSYLLADAYNNMKAFVLQAEFENENEFVLHFNQLCRINNFYFYFLINGQNTTTTMQETSNFIKTNIASSFK